jgi:hypothetical protein
MNPRITWSGYSTCSFRLISELTQKTMIDTVIIKIPRNEVQVMDMGNYGVKWNLQSSTNIYDKFVRNPSPHDLAQGSYFPRLTGYKRKGKGPEWESSIRIEFSVPKLLYDNNLDEIEEKDFDRVFDALKDRLEQMGLIVSRKQLENAPITTVHYSKNIILTSGYSAQYVIRELHKINLNKRFDLTRARFANDGQSLYGYTEAHSFVFYDKISDLSRPKKRAIDRNQSITQLSLLGELKEKKEILRFEIRLCQKRKINSLFNRLGFPEKPTFKDILSIEKAKAVLNYYWTSIIEEGAIGLFSFSLTTKELLDNILLTGPPKPKGKQAVYLVGLLQLAKEGNGLRELRSILTKNGMNDRSWYRIAQDYKELSKQLETLKPREWLEQIRKQISDYKPFRVKI